jgi:uncharacterized OsmC-like protein
MSNEITVTYEGSMCAKAELPGGGSLAIGAPAGCGGDWDGPSPKDLFVAGYASCVIMAMDMAAQKARFDIGGSKITVSPVWVENEPVLAEINAVITLAEQCTEEQLNVLRKGSHYCPVHNSLRDEIKTSVTFEVA